MKEHARSIGKKGKDTAGSGISKANKARKKNKGREKADILERDYEASGTIPGLGDIGIKSDAPEYRKKERFEQID